MGRNCRRQGGGKVDDGEAYLKLDGNDLVEVRIEKRKLSQAFEKAGEAVFRILVQGLVS